VNSRKVLLTKLLSSDCGTPWKPVRKAKSTALRANQVPLLLASTVPWENPHKMALNKSKKNSQATGSNQMVKQAANIFHPTFALFYIYFSCTRDGQLN